MMSSLSVCYLIAATAVVAAAAAVWRPAESYHVDKYSLLMPNVRPKKVIVIIACIIFFFNITFRYGPSLYFTGYPKYSEYIT